MSLLNCFPYAGNLVGAQVIHHDNIVAPECRNQALLDIGQEYLSVHGTLDHHWGDHFVVTQAGYEGERLPCLQAGRGRSIVRRAERAL